MSRAVNSRPRNKFAEDVEKIAKRLYGEVRHGVCEDGFDDRSEFESKLELEKLRARRSMSRAEVESWSLLVLIFLGYTPTAEEEELLPEPPSHSEVENTHHFIERVLLDFPLLFAARCLVKERNRIDASITSLLLEAEKTEETAERRIED